MGTKLGVEGEGLRYLQRRGGKARKTVESGVASLSLVSPSFPGQDGLHRLLFVGHALPSNAATGGPRPVNMLPKLEERRSPSEARTPQVGWLRKSNARLVTCIKYGRQASNSRTQSRSP